MSVRKNYRLRKGFTLVESLTAIFIVGVTAVILSTTIPLASRSSTYGKARDIATSYSEGILDQIRLLDESQITPTNLNAMGITTSSGNFGTPLPLSPAMFNGKSLTTIIPSATATITLNTLSNNVVQVDVTVGWQDVISSSKGTKIARTLTFSTRKAAF